MRGFSPLFKTQNLSLKAISKYSIAFRTQITAFNFRIQVILPTPLTVGYPVPKYPKYPPSTAFQFQSFHFQLPNDYSPSSLQPSSLLLSTFHGWAGRAKKRRAVDWPGLGLGTKLERKNLRAGPGRLLSFHFLFNFRSRRGPSAHSLPSCCRTHFQPNCHAPQIWEPTLSLD